MRMESSYISLSGVRFRAFHGVLPQEGRVGGDYTVSLRVGYDFSKALVTDDVTDTLDYSALYRLVAREMAVPSQLLEHVAGRIAEAILATFPQVRSIDLCLTKCNPPMGADSEGAGVEIHLINDKTA